MTLFHLLFLSVKTRYEICFHLHLKRSLCLSHSLFLCLSSLRVILLSRIIIIVIIVVFSGADLMRPYCHVIARQTVERARIVQSFFGDT